jgi:phage gp36-like protein
MFLTIDEIKTVLYNYQIDEIGDYDDDVAQEAIDAAVDEVRGYFEASNSRRGQSHLTQQQFANYTIYDIDAIFAAEGNQRNAFVLRCCKTIAAWYICELANVDIVYQHVKERYENVIKTLEKIAGIGQYAGGPTLTLGLPTITPEDNGTGANALPFRVGSRPKFYHE